MTIRLARIAVDPPVVLAPMAGITDLPFRRLVARFGAGLVVSEMVASRDMVMAGRAARVRADPGGDAGCSAVQLAGRDPYWMAEAARMVEAQGARIIDINMGCPAKKVVGGMSGAALMRDLDEALRIIAATVAAVRVPVTLKCRLGWDDTARNAAELARRAVAAGVAMVTVHGRTRAQFYAGRADWAAVAPVVEAAAVPVLVNGDITDTASARRALRQSGAAGVMVGRAARGAPWRLAQIAAGLEGRTPPRAPEGAALADLICDHHDAMLSHFGRDHGLKAARKHLGWYMDHARTPAALRREVLTAGTAARVQRLVRLATAPAEVAAA